MGLQGCFVLDTRDARRGSGDLSGALQGYRNGVLLDQAVGGSASSAGGDEEEGCSAGHGNVQRSDRIVYCSEGQSGIFVEGVLGLRQAGTVPSGD